MNSVYFITLKLHPSCVSACSFYSSFHLTLSNINATHFAVSCHSSLCCFSAGSGRVNLVPLPSVVTSPRDMALAAVICSALATVLLALLVLCIIYCKRQLLEKKPSGESQPLRALMSHLLSQFPKLSLCTSIYCKFTENIFGIL